MLEEESLGFHLEKWKRNLNLKRKLEKKLSTNRLVEEIEFGEDLSKY